MNKETVASWFDLLVTFQETLGDSDPLTQTVNNEYIRCNMEYLTLSG